jgi:hypothetical protein
MARDNPRWGHRRIQGEWGLYRYGATRPRGPMVTTHLHDLARPFVFPGRTLIKVPALPKAVAWAQARSASNQPGYFILYDAAGKLCRAL